MATSRLVLCGQTTEIGRRVTESLKPNYEGGKVIHFFTSVDDAKAGIPDLLAGRFPIKTKPNNVGSHDYTRPPQVVLFGRGYDEAQVGEIRQSLGGADANLVWVQSSADGRKLIEGLKPGQTPSDPSSYGQSGADSVRRVLDALAKDGKLDTDGMYFY